MKQVRNWIIEQTNPAVMNYWIVAIMGYPMKDGWLLNRHKGQAFRLEKFCVELDKNKDLKGKPKLVLMQQYVEGTLLSFKINQI